MSLKGALAGLADAAVTPKGAAKPTPTLSKGVEQAVASFVLGKPKDVCAPGKKGGSRKCPVKATGRTLSVDGHGVAKRDGDKMQVCPAEIPDTVRGRAVANALFKGLNAGVSLRQVGGRTVISGRNPANGIEAEQECFTVRITKPMQASAEANLKKWESGKAKREAASKKRAERAFTQTRDERFDRMQERADNEYGSVDGLSRRHVKRGKVARKARKARKARR